MALTSNGCPTNRQLIGYSTLDINFSASMYSLSSDAYDFIRQHTISVFISTEDHITIVWKQQIQNDNLPSGISEYVILLLSSTGNAKLRLADYWTDDVQSGDIVDA